MVGYKESLSFICSQFIHQDEDIVPESMHAFLNSIYHKKYI
uniref:Uncharacterized protein n=1 Tax=Lepeophtheirus salmonis TaxID=72036 RepID=A0A0K2U646_LEPSM